MSKKLITIFIILALLALLNIFSQGEETSAQQYFSEPTCNQIIPVGEAYEQTILLLNEVYRQFIEGQHLLSLADKQGETALAEMKEKDEFCDFSLCSPQVVDQGPDFKLKLDYLLGTETLAGIHFPLCQAKECIGEPCPNLAKYLKELKTVKDGLKGSYEVIKDIFEEKTITLTLDTLREENEEVGDLVTRPEMAFRQLSLARAWLHSSTVFPNKKNCMPTDSELNKIAEGEIGNRYPMRCTDALEQGIYWPKPWSEECDDVCQNERTPTEECKQCLAKCEGNSNLADINCRIYDKCSDVCQEGKYDKKCEECLCVDNQGKPMNEESCTSWICGGSYYNYVCCYEIPLGSEYKNIE